jgi:DNA-binding transcriptional regulator of glucitol operon
MSTTRRRRPALVALVIIAALTCLGLAWWQWERFQAVTGTGQNLGYALQWPLFAAFVVYAYRKFVRYEEEPPRMGQPESVTEIPPGVLPERPRPMPTEPRDPELSEYNAYLAKLAEDDRRSTA